MEQDKATTIKALFPGRREVEFAVEHLVQEYGIERTDIFIEPKSDDNSAGAWVGGADLESGHPNSHPDTAGAAYEGPLIVSVGMSDDESDAVSHAFRDLGASEVTSR